MEPTLPGKLRNTNSIPSFSEEKLLLNAYRLDITGAVTEVYKYELKFFKVRQARPDGAQGQGGQGGQVVEVELSSRPRHDVLRQQKRNLLWECYEQLLTNNTDFFSSSRHDYCFDCGTNFYSLHELKITSGQARNFDIEHTRLSPESLAYLGQKVVGLRAQLLATETLYLHENGAESHAVAQFFDILSNQEILHQDYFLFFAAKIFQRDSVVRLHQDVRIMKDGMQKNVRYVGDSEDTSIPILQIDAKKAAFFPAIPLINFIRDFIAGPEHRGSIEGLISRNFQEVNKQLRRLMVQTTHLPNNRYVELSGLSNNSSNRQSFQMRGQNHEISVAQYYEQTYNFRLRHPNFQCAVETQLRRDQQGQVATRQNYYPLEVLKIVEGQRITIEKQTGGLVEKMIRMCQVAPHQFVTNNRAAKESAVINNNNPFFVSHQVRIDADLLHAKGNVLHPPAITTTYNEEDRGYFEDLEPSNPTWRLDNNCRFLQPAEAPKWAAVLIGVGTIPANQCTAFVRAFCNEANKRGIPLQQGFETAINSDQIIKLFKQYYELGVKFVLILTEGKPGKLDPVHSIVKELEIDSGIVTQHVYSATIAKALGRMGGGAHLVMENIILKFNLKLGGINYGLTACQALREVSSRNIVTEQWFHPGRMFVGIDMSHAAPQTRVQRRQGAPLEPTVVGMAYTVGLPLHMVGTYWYQEPRFTRVADSGLFCQEFETAVNNHKERTGQYPSHIFLYRAGVSDGDFMELIAREVEPLEKEFKEMADKDADFKPPRITMVVVQQQSNYRIVPRHVNSLARAKPPEQNVMPGTCVDKEVMHPKLTEFLIVPHRAIQGTARPARCTVVWDSSTPRVSLEELENITYVLCYAHGIVLSPVSQPAPLYAGMELAKRGRNNWKQRKDDAVKEGWADQLIPPEDHRENFFYQWSSDMRPTIGTKFWA